MAGISIRAARHRLRNCEPSYLLSGSRGGRPQAYYMACVLEYFPEIEVAEPIAESKDDCKNMQNLDNIKSMVRKSPYKGIMKEIAIELNISRIAVYNQIYVNNNLRTKELFLKKAKQRKAKYDKVASDLASVN